MCKKDEGIVMPNFAALRRRGVSVIYEKPPGGADICPPSGRGLNVADIKRGKKVRRTIPLSGKLFSNQYHNS